MGDVACELDDLEPALHLPEGVVQRLAVLRGEETGEVLLARRHQLPEGEHDILSLGEGREPPGLVGPSRRLHRPVDVVGRRQRHFAGLVSCGRVEHLAHPPRRPLGRGPVNPVLDLSHRSPRWSRT